MLYQRRGWCLALLGVLLLLAPAQGGGVYTFAVAAAFIIAGGALRLWARAHIGLHTRGVRWEAPTLVMGGPYAHMRHPLYLSNGWVGAGVAWFHLGGGWLWAFFVALLFIFLAALARAEDAWLAQRFPVLWVEWARKVPAWGWARSGSCESSAVPLARLLREDVWTWVWWLLAMLIVWARRSLF